MPAASDTGEARMTGWVGPAVAARSPVSDPPDHERLSDRRYVVLVLHLLVDRNDQLLYGDVAGIDAGATEERRVRFRGADGLLGAVHAWLAAEPRTNP
jgi:hypothetical protein